MSTVEAICHPGEQSVDRWQWVLARASPLALDRLLGNRRRDSSRRFSHGLGRIDWGQVVTRLTVVFDDLARPTDQAVDQTTLFNNELSNGSGQASKPDL